jgi:hypothetical protein
MIFKSAGQRLARRVWVLCGIRDSLAGVSWLAEATLASVLVSWGVEGGLVYDLSSGRTDEADARQASLVHAAATQEIGHELGET